MQVINALCLAIRLRDPFPSRMLAVRDYVLPAFPMPAQRVCESPNTLASIVNTLCNLGLPDLSLLDDIDICNVHCCDQHVRLSQLHLERITM